jgi:hypothetical protein
MAYLQTTFSRRPEAVIELIWPEGCPSFGSLESLKIDKLIDHKWPN